MPPPWWTAGVFMVCRLSPMFEYAPNALAMVTIVGATTAIFAATIGLTQTDIKRVIAYSTCSQLGYMFFAAASRPMARRCFTWSPMLLQGTAVPRLGLGHPCDVGRADMRKMGGLYKLIPRTYVLMWIGSLALAGIPLFAGYYSKDTLLEAAFAAHTSFGFYAIGSASSQRS